MTQECEGLQGPEPLRLPAVVSESLVRLRHAVDVLFALVRAALVGLRVGELAGEPLGHRLLATRAGELDEPADGESARPASGDFDRYLVGGATHAPGANLEVRSEGLDRGLERLHWLLVGAPGEDLESVVDDLLRRRLLAVQHHLVDDLLHELRPVDGVGVDRTDSCCGAAWHAAGQASSGSATAT